ncbi:hypothetical protein [Pasteurella oralis]|uniref:hypothetical protein n=1 Tax=Pasteurella oralis TaxID=1071947 RepID=UPI000C7A2A28|nr:hypothetical protein [Pasteurella oralis]
MPTKHIDAELWQKVEEKTVDVIVRVKTMIKETDILQVVLRKGLEQITDDELTQYVLLKKAKGDK